MFDCHLPMGRSRKKLVTALKFPLPNPTNTFHCCMSKQDIQNWCSHASCKEHSLLRLQISDCTTLPFFLPSQLVSRRLRHRSAQSRCIQQSRSHRKQRARKTPLELHHSDVLERTVWLLASIFIFVSVQVN